MEFKTITAATIGVKVVISKQLADGWELVDKIKTGRGKCELVFARGIPEVRSMDDAPYDGTSFGLVVRIRWKDWVDRPGSWVDDDDNVWALDDAWVTGWIPLGEKK